MRDCPACRVPLHGYEDVCPSCGTQQPKSRSSSRTPYGTSFKPAEPSINWVPVVVAFLVIAGGGIWAAQSSWIGQVMRGENKQPDDPIAKMTFADARNTIDTELNKNLTAAGATDTKFTWKSTANAGAEPAPGAPATDDRAVDGPVQLTIDTKLPNKEVRKQIIDPIKPYMEPAKVAVLQMNDKASKANWTYNLTPAAPAENADGDE